MGGSVTHRGRLCLPALAVLVLLAAPSTAAAKVKICVSFHGPKLRNPSEYQRLLESELRHHPTHQVVSRGCATRMYIEYMQLAKGGYLTGRLSGGIPYRVRVARVADLPARLREVVAYLLEREPVFLVENMASSGLLARPAQSMVKHGLNFFGLELYQLLIWAKSDRTPLVGGAFRFRRTVDRWFAGARVEFAYRPGPYPLDLDRIVFQMYGAAQAEVGVNLLRDALVTPYFSALVGASWLRVYGPVDRGGVTERDDLTTALFGVSLRVGVELLRQAAVRMDIFAMVNLPLHKTHNIDSSVIDAYTPSLQVGCGVAF